MLSMLGSLLISGVRTGLLKLRPIPSWLLYEEDLENSDLTGEGRWLGMDSRRRKSVRNALLPGWKMGSDTVAAWLLPNSLPF